MTRTALFSLLVGASLTAQDPTSEAELMALLNTPVTVASSRAMSLRESPGVISYITRDEIQASGARNVVDMLRLIPGFQIAYDTQGSLGLSTRGFWSYDGKCLVLWNDIELNELLYGTVTMADAYPIDQVKRIEIIRGPGSALYGGFAELAVIRFVSVDQQEVKPVAGSIAYGRTKDGDMERQLAAVFSQAANGVNYTVGSGYSKNDYGSSSTTTYLNAMNDNLTFNGFVSNQTIKNPEYPFVSEIAQTKWMQQSFAFKYKFNLDWLTITPYAKYSSSTPWVSDADSGYSRRTVERSKFGVTTLATISKNWAFGFGVERYLDAAWTSSQDTTGSTLTTSGATSITYSNNAAYGEVEYAGLVNVTLGGRYEHHSYAGEKFVPRVAVTKAFETWHVKLLYAEAFRTPSVLNIGAPSITNTSPIEPETTTTYEVELGKQFGKHFLTLNAYRSELEKPLVWRKTSMDDYGGYYNGPSVESKGLEFDYKVRGSWGFVTAAFSKIFQTNNVPDWQVPGDDSRSLGLASDTGKIVANFVASPNFEFGGSVIYSGNKFAYNIFGEVEKFSPKTFVNLNATYHFKSMSAVVGVYDLLDQKELFLQSYAGGVPAMEGRGTEYYIKLKYGF